MQKAGHCRARAIAAWALFAGAAGTAFAQTYPAKPIKMMIGFESAM